MVRKHGKRRGHLPACLSADEPAAMRLSLCQGCSCSCCCCWQLVWLRLLLLPPAPRSGACSTQRRPSPRLLAAWAARRVYAGAHRMFTTPLLALALGLRATGAGSKEREGSKQSGRSKQENKAHTRSRLQRLGLSVVCLVQGAA